MVCLTSRAAVQKVAARYFPNLHHTFITCFRVGLGTLFLVWRSSPDLQIWGMMGEWSLTYSGFHDMTVLPLFSLLYLLAYIYQFLHHSMFSGSVLGR
jgi:hypothetical protein